MADALWRGRRLRRFNVNDECKREALRIEVDSSLSAARVIRAHSELDGVRGASLSIRMDNEPLAEVPAMSAECRAKLFSERDGWLTQETEQASKGCFVGSVQRGRDR